MCIVHVYIITVYHCRHATACSLLSCLLRPMTLGIASVSEASVYVFCDCYLQFVKPQVLVHLFYFLQRVYIPFFLVVALWVFFLTPCSVFLII